MKFLISGGSGFIGSHLSASLVQDGHEVVVLARSSPPGAAERPRGGLRYMTWDSRTLQGDWISELSSSHGVINLAGANIGTRRWTRRRMAELIGSRLSATSAIVRAIEQTPAERRPRVLVSASGIDYYGDRRDDAVLTEDAAPGDSFLARLTQQWEGAAQKAAPLGVRVCCIRTAMAFGREAPAFRLLTLPFRLFVGGPLGDGRQWFTWIHIDDLVGIYRLALENSTLRGPINATAPDVRPQRDVAKEIGRVMHRPSLFPVPAPILQLALGQQSQLLLHGRRASPAKAQAAGYAFRFGGLHEALQDLLRGR
jgi:uncharacterized protein (TIGR01777 family)